MRVFRLLNAAVISLLLACCALAQQNERKNTDDIQQFWTKFRAAILSEDKEKVAALTKFPFEVRGPDDSDPLVYYDKNGFLGILDEILNQPVHQMKGSNLNSTTMGEIVRNKTEVLDKEIISENFARVDLFTFVKEKNRWLFNRAYFEK
jgi:hypothetical protein